MEIKVENIPVIDRDSWVGKLIEATGAKTWCSLLIRGSIALSLLILYGIGWYFSFNISKPSPAGLGDFLIVVLIALTWVVTFLGAILGLGWLYEKIKDFNCWAQNKCTPIFKDE